MRNAAIVIKTIRKNHVKKPHDFEGAGASLPVSGRVFPSFVAHANLVRQWNFRSPHSPALRSSSLSVADSSQRKSMTVE